MDKNVKVDEDVAGRCELTQMEALAYALWGSVGARLGRPRSIGSRRSGA